MVNSADPDQLAFSEANAGYIQAQKDKVKTSNVPGQSISYKTAYVPSKDSDQKLPVHPYRLI